MNILDRFRKDSKFALLLMLALALILLIVLIFVIGFSLWFWFILILWILFALIFYFKLIVLFEITQFISWISFVILLIFSIIMMFVGDASSGSSATSKSGSSGKSRVACTSDSTNALVSIDGWTASLYSQTINSNSEADTGTRTFSISALASSTGEDIYFRIKKADGGSVSGAKGALEVCDSNNMTDRYSTTKDTTTKPASDNAISVAYYLHGNNRVQEPGTYRVDAYAHVDGAWKLVGRDTITVTEN